jgi:hypothetical protein
MTLAIYESALNWLGMGYHVLPIQPGTKKQATGFGLHQKQIINAQEAKQYFYDEFSRYNLAVVAPEGSFVLDFDDWNLYLSWLRFVKKFEDRITTSYTEITPNNGAHVFLSGQIPFGIQLVDHVEIKRIVLVAPSTVNGIEYESMQGETIYKGSLDACFFPLSKSSPPFPVITGTATPAAQRMRTPLKNSQSKIDAIKANFSIVNLMKKHFPKTLLRGHGKFLTACCPFHKETEASFWINAEKNIFGCHACKVKGDVINFFALVNGIENKAAIVEMAEAL